jgi:hypothetical protein
MTHTPTHPHTHTHTHTETHTHSHTQKGQRRQLTDMIKVLDNMKPLMNGFAGGHAFNSCMGDNPMNHSVALAALTVVRYSFPGETIWDLCEDRPLLALPLATMHLRRNYICISGQAASYNTMVDNMYSCNFLKKECKLLYDGKWNANSGAYCKLTVNHSYSYYTIALRTHFPPNTQRPTHTTTTTTTGAMHSVRGSADRSLLRPRVVDALPDPMQGAPPVPR